MNEKDTRSEENAFVNSSDNTNKLQKNAAFISYFNALDPRIFNPITLKRGGMTKISFYDQDRSNIVNIYRTIALYDNYIGVQDEIHLNC